MNYRQKKKQGLFPGLAIFVLTGILVLGLLAGCSKSDRPRLPKEKKRELANVLYNQQLFAQAIREYEDYLNHYELPEEEQANIAYTIGNIYFERLHDYENALAYYLRVKYLYPESKLQNQVSKRMVECLERMKRSVEAQQVMEQTAALDESQKPQSHPGEVIARIGKRKITTGDLQYELNQLPVYLREQIKTREQKIEFLKNYIVQELLYDSARRKGLDKDPDVRAALVRAEKSIMSQKLLQDEINKEARLDQYSDADVELYYKANKEKYAERDENGKIKRIPSFREVKERVAQDFIQEKQQQAYQRLIERLMKAEQVEIYEDKFK